MKHFLFHFNSFVCVCIYFWVSVCMAIFSSVLLSKIPLKHSWYVNTISTTTIGALGAPSDEIHAISETFYLLKKGFRNGFSPWFMVCSANVPLKESQELSLRAYWFAGSPNFSQLVLYIYMVIGCFFRIQDMKNKINPSLESCCKKNRYCKSPGIITVLRIVRIT